MQLQQVRREPTRRERERCIVMETVRFNDILCKWRWGATEEEEMEKKNNIFS